MNLPFADIFRAVIYNERLIEYEKYLVLARKNGYRMGGVSEFITRDEKKCPFLIIRHDIDVLNIGVKEVLDIEEKLGITSSWYFRWNTINRQVIKQIRKNGSEVSLHYETLSDVCRSLGIHKQKDISDSVRQIARELLIKEIRLFRESYHVPCLTIAPHGDPLNRKLQIPNHSILDQDLYTELAIQADAYSNDLLNQVDCYVSDTSPIYNRGWAYQVSLPEAILNNNFFNIYFLSHPHHWYFKLSSKLKLISKLVIRGNKNTPPHKPPVYRQLR